MIEFKGILTRINGSFYLKFAGQSIKLEMPRMPVDVLEKHVIIQGYYEDNAIIAEAIRLDENYKHPAVEP